MLELYWNVGGAFPDHSWNFAEWLHYCRNITGTLLDNHCNSTRILVDRILVRICWNFARRLNFRQITAGTSQRCWWNITGSLQELCRTLEEDRILLPNVSLWFQSFWRSETSASNAPPPPSCPADPQSWNVSCDLSEIWHSRCRFISAQTPPCLYFLFIVRSNYDATLHWDYHPDVILSSGVIF